MTSTTTTRTAVGPLVVSEANPRYFEIRGDDGQLRAVYLTGAHVNNNFHDGMGPGAECPDEPDRFDFDAYLRWLTDHGHNFIRLWRWEQFKSQVGGGAVHACMSPQPWPRTGPGRRPMASRSSTCPRSTTSTSAACAIGSRPRAAPAST